MTRHVQIIQAAMRELKKERGEFLDEAVLHHRLNKAIIPKPSLTEVSDALEECEEHGWATYVVTPLKSREWMITKKGIIADKV